MAVAKYLARHCYLVFAILCWSSIVVGTAANVPCSCVVDGPRKATLVLADGASGSTWLGQMLDNHPCSSAFVHNSTRLDGKAYINSIRELADMLQENKRAAKVLQPAAMKGSSSSGNSSNLSPPPHPQLGYGLVVPWQAIDKLLHDSTRHAGPRGGARSTSSIRHQDDHLLPPLHVVVLLRDPFFWVLSQVKKLALRSDASRLSKDGLKCTNIHQRGTALCPITSTYQFAPDPAVLDHRIKEFEARIELMRAVGAAAALRWGPRPTNASPSPSADVRVSVGEHSQGCNEPLASTQPQAPTAASSGLNLNQTTSLHCTKEVDEPQTKIQNNNNYAELDYAELLCAGSALGQNALPRYLSRFVGLGTCTAAEHAASGVGSSQDRRRLTYHNASAISYQYPSSRRRLRASRKNPSPSQAAETKATTTTATAAALRSQAPPQLSPSRTDHSAVLAVKTSPSAVRQELKNWAEIMAWANEHLAPWRSRLKLTSESALLGNCTRAVRDPRGELPLPLTLVRPSLASPASYSSGMLSSRLIDGIGSKRRDGGSVNSAPPAFVLAESSGYHGLDLKALAAPQHLAKARANLHRLHDEYLAMVSGSSSRSKKSSRGHGKRGNQAHG